jgi:DNA-binding MarR family transcriptional regulator
VHSKFDNLDLFDLISERHIQLCKIAEQAWNNSSEIPISNSEWSVISKIYNKLPTVSHIAKHGNISRQAVHKIIKSLKEKSLVEVNKSINNKKEKCLQLTALGERCYIKNISLKAAMEEKIEDKIGKTQFEMLKKILKSDWGLDG